MYPPPEDSAMGVFRFLYKKSENLNNTEYTIQVGSKTQASAFSIHLDSFRNQVSTLFGNK